MSDLSVVRSDTSGDVAVRLEEVGKMYKIFTSRFANLKDALGLPSARKSRYNEFWAVRGIDFELRRGQRIGIIGRNGAGKSTILKLITQNLAPTEGSVEVHGQVQALLDTGGGLHPEFTGDENIEAALTVLGLSKAEIREARHDIAEFTELGRFLGQPFKTYSLGMQARLAFGIATTIQPEILIIDEVLGAGDAYFFSKSAARMRDLLTSGAAVLLVSHALDQIVRFCDEAMWLDRGRIVMRGPSTEVIKAYEKFIRELDDRRLQAKNQKTRLESFDAFERESYTDHFTARLTAAGARVEIAELSLARDGQTEDRIEVGSPQDADANQSAFILLDGWQWTPPQERPDGGFYRAVEAAEGATAAGTAIFHAWFVYPTSEYAISVRYRSDREWTLALGLSGRIDVTRTLPASAEWRVDTVVLPREPATQGPPPDDEAETQITVARARTHRSRWEGIGGLVMDDVALLDEHGREQAVFHAGRPMSIAVDVSASSSGSYPVILAALVFRLDGIVVTRHLSDPTVMNLAEGDAFRAVLDLGPIQLGNGHYVVSLGLYRKLDLRDIDPSEFYDYFDRSFEFQVDGNPPLHNELVRHPGTWSIEPLSVEQRLTRVGRIATQ